MRILALDYGSKRVGVAISDPSWLIASPLEFIPAEPYKRFLARLRELIAEREVSLIVVGMPRNMDGSYGPAAERVREFVKRLKEELAPPIKTWDERLTTVQAHRALIQADMSRKKRKRHVDKTAAAILLQSYLDSLAFVPPE